MANGCTHMHFCFEPSCGRPFVCEFPECIELAETYQRTCDKCSYIYGWRQKQDNSQNDWSAL